MKKALLFSASCAVLGLASASAPAQTLDYATFQDMFGEPVTTSANGSPQRLSEVPLNMEILTAEEIARTGARTVPEALRFLPGLTVRQSSFGQTEVSIRGYNQPSAERLLVLVNGRQVYTDFFGMVVWDNIPVEMAEIKQIEVIKGPNTALFGFNATSGVVNIITYNPLYDDVREVTARLGTSTPGAFYEGSGVATAKLGDAWAAKVSLGGYKADEEFAGYPNSLTRDPKRASGSVDIWGQVTDTIQVNFEVTSNQNDRMEVIPIRVYATGEQDVTSVRGRIIADTDWGLIEGDVYHNATIADFDIETGVPYLIHTHIENEITVARLTDTFEVGNNHIFRLGGEYRTASNIMEPLDADELTYTIGSAMGLWDWRATDKLRTSVGVRYDHFALKPGAGFGSGLGLEAVFPLFGLTYPIAREDMHQTLDEYSYNIGAVYQLTDRDTLRVSTARGIDLPSFVELGIQSAYPVELPPAFLFGGPETQTAVITNYEIGWDRRIPQIDGLLRTSVFYQYNDEMQGVGSSFDGPIALTGNLGDSEIYGVELGLEGTFRKNWDWFVNYSFSQVDDSDLRNRNVSGFTSFAEYENSHSEHTVNAHLGYTADRWRADGFLQYTSGFDEIGAVGYATIIPPSAAALSDVDDAFVLNANVAFDITDDITWSVAGTSLLGNTEQTAYGEAQTMVWTSLTWRF
jgi:outer membrane receptor for ferrienterochelin and colicins